MSGTYKEYVKITVRDGKKEPYGMARENILLLGCSMFSPFGKIMRAGISRFTAHPQAGRAENHVNTRLNHSPICVIS